MRKMLYHLYYRLRRYINYIRFRTLYRLIYPEMMPYEWVFENMNYSKAALKFLKAQIKDQIQHKCDIMDEKSVLVDVGGHTGEWAMELYSRHKPFIYIFEPNPGLVEKIKGTFADELKKGSGSKVKVLDYGLGAANETAVMSNIDMGSSTYASSPEFDNSDKLQIGIRDITEVLDELSLETIDFIKINIEGGEYDLLPRMIETGIVNRCKVIRVQFHDWIPGSFSMRKRIVKELAKTHDVEWSYPMVWESWIRKDLSANRGSRADNP